MSAEITSTSGFLNDLRWGVDKHVINYENEHVWMGPCEQGGFTDCCYYGYECERHKPIREAEDAADWSIRGPYHEDDGKYYALLRGEWVGGGYIGKRKALDAILEKLTSEAAK